MDIKSRFWSKVKRGASHECWEWTAYCNPQGYGRVKYGGRNDGAHRVALIISGSLPTCERPHALHSCDNPKCCNPSHLRWGTNGDNVRDTFSRNFAHVAANRERVAKMGREVVLKAQMARRVITKERADEIRAFYSAGKTQRECAAHFGVSKSMVHELLSGRTYKN